MENCCQPPKRNQANYLKPGLKGDHATSKTLPKEDMQLEKFSKCSLTVGIVESPRVSNFENFNVSKFDLRGNNILIYNGL